MYVVEECVPLVLSIQTADILWGDRSSEFQLFMSGLETLVVKLY